MKKTVLFLFLIPAMALAGFFYTPARFGVTYSGGSSSSNPFANLDFFWDYQFNTTALPTSPTSFGFTNSTSWTDTNSSRTLTGVFSNSPVGAGPWQAAGGTQYLALSSDIVISSANPWLICAFVAPYFGGGSADQCIIGSSNRNTMFGLFTNNVGFKINGVVSAIPVPITNACHPYFITASSTGGAGLVEWTINGVTNGTTPSLGTNITLHFVGNDTNSTPPACFVSIMNIGISTNRHWTTAELTNLFYACITNGQTTAPSTNGFYAGLHEGTGTTVTEIVSNLSTTFAGAGLSWSNTGGPNGAFLSNPLKTGWLDWGTGSTNIQYTHTHVSLWARSSTNAAGGKGIIMAKMYISSTGTGPYKLNTEGSNPTWREVAQITNGTLFFESQGQSANSGKLSRNANGALNLWHKMDFDWDDNLHTGYAYLDGVAFLLPPDRDTVNASCLVITPVTFFVNGGHGEPGVFDLSDVAISNGEWRPIDVVKATNGWLMRTDLYANP